MQSTILLSLPANEFDSVLRLAFAELSKHALLNEIAQPIEWAYFVNDGLASFLNVMADGKSVEVGLAGKEGFVGVPLLVGFSTSPSRAVMQVDGSAFRISPVDLQAALEVCPNLNRSLQRFGQVLGMQATQVAACNRLHEVDRRLARWLLMSQDRLIGRRGAADTGDIGEHAGNEARQRDRSRRHSAKSGFDHLPARRRKD